MSLRLSISWWGNQKLQHNLKVLNNKINIKFDLYNAEIKLSKFLKPSLNVTLQ